jgi:hypothetical protein
MRGRVAGDTGAIASAEPLVGLKPIEVELLVHDPRL